MVRHRVVQRLRTSPQPVICVRAPAGYGKTTALRQWAAVDGRPCAWLSLSTADDDPLVMGGRLTAAIAAAQPATAALYLVPGTDAAFSRVVLPALSRRLTEVVVPFILVLDDVQQIAGAAAIRLLSFLTGSMPEGCQVVLVSRSKPPVPVARLRSAGRVCELGPADLAFDRSEAELLLAGTGLPRDSVDATVMLAQGWPAGLALLADLLVPAGRPDARIDARLGRDRAVVEYLRAEMWTQLTDGELEFLTRTSALPEVSGPLCDTMLDRSGSGAVLADLVQRNVLLQPADSREQRFHYHPLLREALLSELERRETTSSVAVWHGRAAAALAAVGDLPAAITAASRAGDVPLTGGLIWQGAGRAVGAGSPASVRTWLDALPDRQIASSPELSAASAWTALLVGDARACKRWTASARMGLDPRAGSRGARSPGISHPVPVEPPARAEVAASLDLLDALTTDTDRSDAGFPEPADVLSRLDPASDWVALGCWIAAVHALLAGDRPAADHLLRQGDLLGETLDSRLPRALCLGLLAGLALQDGRAADSSREAGAALAALSSGVDRLPVTALPLTALPLTALPLTALPLTALPHSVIAAVQARNGELAAARRSLTAARRLSAAGTAAAAWYSVLCSAFQAMAGLRLGELTEARALHRQARAAYDRCPASDFLDCLLEAVQCELADRCADGLPGRPALTNAELRVLRYLPTQLSFPEIAGGLFVSRHTVKTQALSIYHKLGVRSRTAAVDRARSFGLLPSPAP